MNHDPESNELMSEAIGRPLSGAWKRWTIRLVIGIVVVEVVIANWPSLWWIALAYAPFPLFSAIMLLRFRRQHEV